MMIGDSLVRFFNDQEIFLHCMIVNLEITEAKWGAQFKNKSDFVKNIGFVGFSCRGKLLTNDLTMKLSRPSY